MTLILSIERAVFVWINRSAANPFFDWLMPVFDREKLLAGVIFAILVPVFFAGSKKLRTTLVMLGITAVLTFGVNGVLLKKSIKRPRPYHNETFKSEVTLRSKAEPVDDYSFPSTHAATAFAMALVCAARHRRSIPFMYFGAAVMGFSRTYVGVHYPLDVAGGAVSGTAIALLVLFAWNRIQSSKPVASSDKKLT